MFYEWPNFEDFEMQFIVCQSSTIWTQTFVDLKNFIEVIKKERLQDVFQTNARRNIKNLY